MKRMSCMLAVLVLASYIAIGQEPKTEPKEVEKKTVSWKEPKEDTKAEPTVARRGLSLRERRELGLTLPHLAKIAAELKAEGELTADTPHSEAAALIAWRLQDQNPKAFAEAEAFDIQSILDLIERLMPFILMLIDLFS